MSRSGAGEGAGALLGYDEVAVFRRDVGVDLGLGRAEHEPPRALDGFEVAARRDFGMSGAERDDHVDDEQARRAGRGEDGGGARGELRVAARVIGDDLALVVHDEYGGLVLVIGGHALLLNE